MKVTCEIELDGDHGTVPGIRATCTRCGNETESFGTGENSIRRCLALMWEECPAEENNYYAPSDTVY